MYDTFTPQGNNRLWTRFINIVHICILFQDVPYNAFLIHKLKLLLFIYKCMNTILIVPFSFVIQSLFLNQACAVRPAHTWFLEIALVREVGVHVCVWVCVWVGGFKQKN